MYLIKIRRALGFEKTKKVHGSIHDNKVIIEPIYDFLDLGGSLATEKLPLTYNEVHEEFAKDVAKEAGIRSIKSLLRNKICNTPFAKYR